MEDQVRETPEKKFLRRSEAATYVRARYGMPCSTQWLAKLACVSTDGPVFRLAGRTPLYAPEDLDKWVEARLSEPMCATGIPAATKKRP